MLKQKIPCGVTCRKGGKAEMTKSQYTQFQILNGRFENRLYKLRIRFYFLKKLTCKSAICNHVRQKINVL